MDSFFHHIFELVPLTMTKLFDLLAIVALVFTPRLICATLYTDSIREATRYSEKNDIVFSVTPFGMTHDSTVHTVDNVTYLCSAPDGSFEARTRRTLVSIVFYHKPGAILKVDKITVSPQNTGENLLSDPYLDNLGPKSKAWITNNTESPGDYMVSRLSQVVSTKVGELYDARLRLWVAWADRDSGAGFSLAHMVARPWGLWNTVDDNVCLTGILSGETHPSFKVRVVIGIDTADYSTLASDDGTWKIRLDPSILINAGAISYTIASFSPQRQNELEPQVAVDSETRVVDCSNSYSDGFAKKHVASSARLQEQSHSEANPKNATKFTNTKDQAIVGTEITNVVLQDRGCSCTRLLFGIERPIFNARLGERCYKCEVEVQGFDCSEFFTVRKVSKY